ncbi:MAG TPA: glycosyltransferase family 39 protein [bacterium]|nr:glycosyltransferase family 39 protein [bacterium]
MKKNRGIKNNLISKIIPGLLPVLVFLFFVLVHLPDLGHDNFNTDVWKWKSRSYNFGSAILGNNLEQSLQTYHPGVVLMWLGGAGAKITNYLAESQGRSVIADDSVDIIFQIDFAQKILVVLVTALTISSVFHIFKKIFGLKYAVISIFLLTLEPFYLGLTRVFHLEGLVSTFMLASIVWLYYFFLDSKKIKRLIVSALFASLSILTKTSALFLVLYFGLVTLIFVYRDGKYNFKKTEIGKFLKENIGNFLAKFGKVFFIWIGVLIFVFFALWPAMWVAPGKVIQSLYAGINDIGVEGDHFQFYFGKLVENPGPSFYFVVLALKSSIYLLVGFIGALIIRKKLPENLGKFMDYLLIFTFFYFIQLTIPTKKLDRYILPALVVISLISSMFYVWVFEKISIKKVWQKAVCVILFFIPAIYTNMYVHPDYFSYFNPMFGGLKTGVKVIEPKWLIGSREVVDYFTDLSEKTGMEASWSASFEELVYKAHGKNLEKAMTVGFKEKYYSQIWPFFREKGTWAVIESLTPFATKTKYFVYPVWDDTSSQEKRFGLTYFDNIKLRGVPLYNVYKSQAEGVND